MSKTRNILPIYLLLNTGEVFPGISLVLLLGGRVNGFAPYRYQKRYFFTVRFVIAEYFRKRDAVLKDSIDKIQSGKNHSVYYYHLRQSTR